jgi:hypothetical protein
MIGDYNWKTLSDNYNEVRQIYRPAVISCSHNYAQD